MPFVASHHRGIAPSGIITEGLIGRWPLDEGSGNVAGCSHGPGPDGNIVGSPTWITGQGGTGYALDFDQSVTQEILLGTDPSLDISGDCAFMCWARVPNRNALSGLIVIALSSFPINYCLLLWNGRLGFLYGDHDSGQPMRYTTARYDDGTWRHFAGVMDAGERILYIDGVEDPVYLDGSYSFDQSYNALVGVPWGTSGRLIGATDDFRIYDRAPSPAEIAAIASGNG